MPSSLVLHGAAVGLKSLTGLNYDPAFSYAGCRICGKVYQSEADRNPVGLLSRNPRFCTIEEVNAFATELRRNWSRKHAKEHSDKEHLDLAYSGQWCTPEAALLLAAFGTIPLTGDASIEQALLESSPVPLNDCEG